MKTRIRSIIALLLVLCMSLSIFACDNSREGDDDPNNSPGNTANQIKSKPINVYRETAVSLGDDIPNIWDAVYHDERIYFTKSVYNETDGTSGSQFVSVSITDPTDVKIHLEIENSYSSEENIYSSTYINSFAIAPNGAIWANIVSYYEDYRDEMNPIYENTNYLRCYDDMGTQTNEIVMSELIPDEPYLYVGGIKFVGDTIYISSDYRVLVVDGTTGTLVTTISDGTNSYINQLVELSGGRIGATLYDYENGGQVIKIINTDTNEWSETIGIDGASYFNWVMPGDGQYIMYYSQYNLGIMGLKADGTSEEIVNFINSDIDGSEISNIIKLGDGEFLMFSYDYVSYSGAKISRLTKVPDDEIKETIMLTYACLYVDYNVRRQILSFNKSNGEYRISIKDYSQYNTNEDYMAGYDRLNADIIGGNIPDIMSLDNLDFRTYANKGILADLYELMDASTVADKSDYVQNVLKAAEYNGKLYRFIPQFSIQTLLGKKSIVGGRTGWTIDDLQALLASIPGSQAFSRMTSSDVLYACLNLTVDSFIDWETGQCSFDENFVKVLQFAAAYPDEIDWDALYSDPNYWQESERDYSENRVLLMQAHVSGYRSIRDYEYQFAEDIAFIGYPTSSGSGTVFNGYAQYGISATGLNKQVCFDFLAGLVETTPDFENSNGYFYGNFSLSQAYNDAVKKYEMTPMRQRPGYVNYEDEMIGEKYAMASARAMPMPADPDYVEDDYTANYHLSAEEIAEIEKLFEITTSFYMYNEAVMNIIVEEAAEFFAKRKSADDTARMIQSRVSILVSESM